MNKLKFLLLIINYFYIKNKKLALQDQAQKEYLIQCPQIE